MRLRTSTRVARPLVAIAAMLVFGASNGTAQAPAGSANLSPNLSTATSTNFQCLAHNDFDWRRAFASSVGDFNGDGREDVFLLGSPTSWLCLGPGLNCTPHNDLDWKGKFRASSGDYDGDGLSDLFLLGSPTSFVCAG